MSSASRPPKSSTATFAKIKAILGEHEIPEEKTYNGSGGPGRLLEDLVGVAENNHDSPDLDDWELKFHGGSGNPVTLFHKEPEPRGIMRLLVHEHGWEDALGRISLRHTFGGKSDRGFYVVNEDDRVVIRHETVDTVVPFWRHDTLLNILGGKLRRLILVEGQTHKNPRRVTYKSAKAFWDFRIRDFCEAMEKGDALIDFDARTKLGPGTALRNHGTKIRVKVENLSKFYHSSKTIT
ncbi:MAG: MvaI/BcnI family restriction endonuclease [Verrucomicrobiales bacterium]|nr:MvaI/BcnI family restriction endonuclease [Verrucomicrobiales bacterium]